MTTTETPARADLSRRIDQLEDRLYNFRALTIVTLVALLLAVLALVLVA